LPLNVVMRWRRRRGRHGGLSTALAQRPELSPFLNNRRHPHAAVHRVQDAICAEPERDWNMPAMAAVGHVTERHLLRLFVHHAGMSPLKFLRVIRLERARQLIERGTSVTQAAEIAGFRSDLHLRRAWNGQWGGSPRDAQKTAIARQRIIGRSNMQILQAR
jgi:transcriptional regulator GlxA family with amidase domain